MANEHVTTQQQGYIDAANVSSGGSTVTNIQRFAEGIYASDGDKTFSTYELSELKALPKSLFYDAATSHGNPRGLFAYYVLGKNRGQSVPYYKSETKDYLPEITPIESRNPTAKMIIDTVSKKTAVGPAYVDPTSPYRGQVYNVKDFIFCKHYGIIPNNRMLTLRRFAYPTLDSLRVLPPVSGEFKKNGDTVKFDKVPVPQLGMVIDIKGVENSSLPVAQAVTYFGDDTGNSLAAILGISTGLNFSYETQDPMKSEQTGDPGLMNSPFGDLIKSFVSSGQSNINIEDVDNLLSTFVTPEKNINALKRKLLDNAVQADGPLSKKIFVNVNTVNKMMTRKQGFSGGDEASRFTLNFYYNLTSVGEMNTKLLFLDLMTNLLSIGSDYGQFLAPELRLEQSSVGLGFPGGAKGYAQSIVDPIGYLKEQVSRVLSEQNVNNQLSAEGSISKDIEKATQELKDFINTGGKKEIPKDGKFYNSIAVLLSDLFLKRIYYQPLMLSGYPTGEWHLVVGNPLNPIAMIGNLVCTNVTINFNDDLGPDDFPTEIKATFTLSPGRQRHRGDWESMFNRGNGRLYLGQLVSSGESTNAFKTTSGVYPNKPGATIEQITQQTAANATNPAVGGQN
jgi:hypothetical protein